MPRTEIKVPDIVTPNHLKRIGDFAAQEAARYFLSFNNGNQRFRVKHEPTIFVTEEPPGITPMATRPDLWIFDLEKGEERFLELTTNTIHVQLQKTRVCRELRNGITIYMDEYEEVVVDPKARQKEVMRRAAPDILYEVWYREDLLEIQRANPGFNFFRGKDWKNGNNGNPNRNRRNGRHSHYGGK